MIRITFLYQFDNVVVQVKHRLTPRHHPSG